MVSKSKILGAITAITLLFSACGSSQSKDTTAPTPTTTIPADIVAAANKLTLNQVWSGNSVSVILVDSKGQDCVYHSGKASEECYGFYFGWTANFEDKDRVISYDDKSYTAIISELRAGDAGTFDVLYQELDNSPQYIAKRIPFAYKG